METKKGFYTHSIGFSKEVYGEYGTNSKIDEIAKMPFEDRYNLYKSVNDEEIIKVVTNELLFACRCHGWVNKYTWFYLK